ncbi:hypothetical protein BLA29_012791 [Euroglyphus maynei]|uniref:Uncharacterized protein n=1 Tax=Euroglyphus maynei TaxID=6958 RepID=A0A1Y3B688_EURMA|nr:hypothetical protein BLA29_012791 [Euroglyphus maynei]
MAEIDWDRLFNEATSGTGTRTRTTRMPGTTFDFDHAINGDNNQATTDWSDLISQIMNGMSTTTTPTSTSTSMTTNWEDMINEMIREFNRQQQQQQQITNGSNNHQTT